jgi:hypothetical protein
MSWSGVVGSLLKKAASLLRFTRVRQVTLSRPATADLDAAPANSGNLMGFLDAFKAVLRAEPALPVQKPHH